MVTRPGDLIEIRTAAPVAKTVGKDLAPPLSLAALADLAISISETLE